MQNLIGLSFGRYHIIEKLGEGGMAVVYKAFDTHLECEVAVKVIRTDQLAPAVLERTMKRFEREAKEVAKLNHPNIVRVMDYGEHEGIPFLVMPYLHGGTLKQLLGSPLPWQQAVSLVEPIARALDYAHQHKMVHRDVKPSNILITDSGEVMLTDFGIVKMLDIEEGNTLTGTGIGLGTPEYMAPEQWVGEFTPAVDQYSLGVVFYELVTGRKPYSADTPAAVLLKQANEPLPRPRSFVPSLPPEVEHLIFKSLAKQPADRFKGMDEFAAKLKKLASQENTEKIHPDYAANKIETSVADNEFETTDDVKTDKQVSQKPFQASVPPKSEATHADPVRWKKLIIGASLGVVALLVLIIGITNGWFTRSTPVETAEVASSSQVGTTPEFSTETSAAMDNSPSPAFTSTPSRPYQYVVQESDTCFSIAEEHNADLLFFLLINNFKDGSCPITPGMAVSIPAPGQLMPTSTPVPPDVPRGTRVEYTIQIGDTIASIAENFRSTVDDIINLNGLTDINAIQAGQKIVVPVNLVTSTPALTFNTPASTSTPNFAAEGLSAGSSTISDVDGMTLRYVPAGEFAMGSPDGVGDNDEHPQHTVYLDAYWIDQTEVTNAMYQQCVESGVCTPPVLFSSETRDSYYENPSFSNYPVIYMDWTQAHTYCEWAGRQLPTEAQWEKAARGISQYTYPWGNDFSCKKGNFDDAVQNPAYLVRNCDGYTDTSPVASFPGGVSPYGAFDMAGNVWEWTADQYDEDYYTQSPSSNPLGAADTVVRVLRGGSWESDDIRSANRYTEPPSIRVNFVGFRCALPVQ